MTRIGLAEIAAQAGVSLATVSKVLNDREGVGAATRVRVRAVADALGYESRLRTHTRGSILVVAPDSHEPFRSLLLSAMARELDSSEFASIVTSTENSRYLPEDGESAGSVGYGPHRIRGVVVLATTISESFVRRLRSAQTPVIAIEPLSATPRGTTAAVSLNNQQVGKNAATYLLDLGHRAVAHIAGPVESEGAAERTLGFLHALRRAKCSVNQAHLMRSPFSFEGGLNAMRQILAVEQKPTAVFAACDDIALGAIRACVESGLRVPEDIGVIGVDDVAAASRATPPLTTFRQPYEEFAATALQLIREYNTCLADNKIEFSARYKWHREPIVARVDAQFILRKSVI